MFMTALLLPLLPFNCSHLSSSVFPLSLFCLLQMVKMMIVCVCVFTLCWLPFNSLMVIGDQYPELYELPDIIYLWFACHWLAMSHTCYNPGIYCWMNEKYRHGFKMVFRCMGTRKNMAQQSTMNVSLATSVKRTVRVDTSNTNSISRAWGQTRFSMIRVPK